MSDRELRRLAQELSDSRRRLRALETQPQLANSSLEDGSVNVYDLAGQVSLILGKQYDGSFVAAPVAGPTPPMPTQPTVTPVAGGLLVTWDGQFVGDAVAPMDFSRVEVHVSTASGFDATTSLTLRGTVETPRGTDVVVLGLAQVSHYVRLVTRATTGKPSAATPVVGPFEPGAVVTGADLTAVQTTASGKNTVTYSLATPSGSGGRVGDTWFRQNGAGVIYGQWEWDGDSWEPRTLRDEVIASVTAGKIVTGTLAAGTRIIAGSETGNHAELRDDGLRMYEVGPDGILVETGALGAPSSTTGYELALGGRQFTVDSGGRVTSPQVNAGQLYVYGESIYTILDRQPRGVIQRGIQTASSPAATSVNPEYGVFEIAATVYPGRLYVIETSTLRCRNTAAPGEGTVRLRYTTGDTTPNVTSSILLESVWTDQYGTGDAVKLSRLYEPTSTQRLRVLVTVSRLSGGDGYIEGSTSNPIEVWIEDAGPAVPNGGVANNSTTGAPATTAPTQTRQSIWAASWSATYRGDNSQKATNGDMIQGYAQGGGDGVQRALFGFEGPALSGSDYNGQTISQVLGGLPDADIVKVELYLYASHWWNNAGGTAALGYHTQTSAPATFSATATGTTTVPNWPKPGGRWVDITSGWPLSWGDAGGVRGIAIGPPPGESTSATYYGRFVGTPGAAEQPLLRVTYRK